jgi:hypothetical protein
MVREYKPKPHPVEDLIRVAMEHGHMPIIVVGVKELAYGAEYVVTSMMADDEAAEVLKLVQGMLEGDEPSRSPFEDN